MMHKDFSRILDLFAGEFVIGVPTNATRTARPPRLERVGGAL